MSLEISIRKECRLDSAIREIEAKREKEAFGAAQEFIRILNQNGKKPAIDYFVGLNKYNQIYIEKHEHFKWYLKEARMEF